ncbi:hypothetical protein CR513_43270, partial [Mucuna pruriens]
MRLLVVGIIYPISDSQWVSLVQVVPKKSKMTYVRLHPDVVWPMQHSEYIPKVYDQHLLRSLGGLHGSLHGRLHHGIVLGHLVSNRGIEVDKAKVNIIASLPNPASVHEVCSFVGHPCVEVFPRAKEATHVHIDSLSTKLGVSVRAKEFNLEIKDKKGAENVVANHLSRLERGVDPLPIRDEFLEELILCIPDSEIQSVLHFCHSTYRGDHYGLSRIAQKVLDCGFYWPTIF